MTTVAALVNPSSLVACLLLSTVQSASDDLGPFEPQVLGSFPPVPVI